MALERDPYQVLGLTSSASQREITRAYRRLLREHHPDTRTHSATADPAADEELQRVLAAYALLRDPRRRATYDHSRGAPDRQASDPIPPHTGPDTPPIRVRVVVHAAARRVPGFSLRVGPVRWH